MKHTLVKWDARVGFLMKAYLSTSLPRSPPLLPQLDYPAQHTNKDIRVNTPLMRFINDDYRVLVQEEVVCEFTEEHTVGHKLDRCLRGDRRVVPNLVRHLGGGERKFVADTRSHGNGSNSARLGDTDHARVIYRIQ